MNHDLEHRRLTTRLTGRARRQPGSRTNPSVRAPVTVGEGITPPVSVSERNVRVSPHSAPQWYPLCQRHPIRPRGRLELVTCTFAPSPCGHPYITPKRVFTAYEALPPPVTWIPPPPRLPILRLSRRPLLLGGSLPVRLAVDTCSAGHTCSRREHTRGYFVPHLRLSLDVGPHSPPGFCGDAPGSLGHRPALSLVLLDQAS